MEVYYSPERHGFYRGDGIRVPSVSRILERSFPIPKWIDPWYLERGRLVHEATAMIDRDALNWAVLDPAIRPFAEAYRRFRTDVLLAQGAKIIAIEKKVCQVEGLWQGRLDRVYQWGGETMVADIKLGAPQERYWLQLSAYALAYAGTLRGIRRITVALQKDTWYKLERDPDPETHARRWGEEVAGYWKEQGWVA